MAPYVEGSGVSTPPANSPGEALSGVDGKYKPLSEFTDSDVNDLRKFLSRIDGLDLPLSESEFRDSFIRTKNFKGF